MAQPVKQGTESVSTQLRNDYNYYKAMWPHHVRECHKLWEGQGLSPEQLMKAVSDCARHAAFSDRF